MIAGTLEIKLMADMARLQKDMDQAKGLLRGLTGNADLAADGFKKALESIGKSFEASGIRIGAMGAVANSTLGKMGLDLGTVAKASIVAEKALFGIASTAGINGAAAEQVVVKWNAALTQISKDSNQTTAEIITAFSDLVAKGIDSDSALKMLEPIGKAATATGANIRDIAVAAGAGFSKLGIDADRLTKSLDMMAKAGDLGAFELKDMAGYFDMLTAKSASLGAVGEGALAQLAAAAQIARRGTGEASTAANNLANFLDKLNARGTDENFMKRFGVDLQVVKKEAQASGDYIGYMVAKVREITGGDSAKIASLFPDIQAGAFIKQAVTDFDLYKKMADEATQATGVVGEKLDTQMRTSAEKLKSVQINLSGAIGNSQAINTLLEKLEQLADWAARHPEIAAALGIGLATAATVGLVGGAVVAGIGATITAITSLSTAIGGISAIVLANPIIAILFGVAVAGVAVYSYWDEITAAINSFWASTKKAFLNGVETIKKYMSFSFLKDEIAKWAQIGRDLMQGLIDGIMAKYQEIINKIKNLGNDMLKTMKNVLGIRSPSREFFEIGEFAGQGFELGLLSKQEEIEAASKKLAQMAMLNTKEITETATAAMSFRDSKGRFLPAEEAARAVAEYQRASADIAHSLSDALLRGFERGKGFAKNFVLTLKNLFSTLVLRPIIQPIAQGASGVILSMLGMDANASEGGGTGGVSGALNWLSVGKSIWTGLSGGFTAFGNSVAGYISQFGMTLVKGQGMLSSLGTTLVNSAGTISLAASYIGAAAAGISIGTLLAGDKSVLGMDGLTTSSIGSVLGLIISAGNPIGALIGGVLGGAVNALFGMGEKRYGPTNVVGSFSGSGFTGNLQSEWTQKGGLFRSNKSGVDSQDLSQKAQDTLNGITLGVATAFGKLLSVTGESARSIDGWTFAIKRQLTTEEEMKTLIYDLGNSMGEFLIPEIKDFKKEGESLADTAIRLTDTFIVTQAIYDMLGHSAYATGLASLKMRDDLVQLFGGLQQTSSAMSGFYSNFFTADEQRANSWRQLDNTFKALNLTTPQTREEFRRLAEAQDLTTEEGRLMFVALMQLAPAFAAVTDPIEDVTKALEDLAAAAAQAMNSIASSLDQMRGTKVASQFQAQIALSAAMAKVTAAMPWITSWDQLATIQIDDASNYSDANKILISEALAAGAALGQLVKTTEDAAKALKDKVIADAFEALRRAVDAEKDRLTKIYNDQAKALNDNISKLRGLSDALGNALDSINPMSRRAAQAQLTSALLLAKTGGIFPTADELSGALRAVSEPSEKLFSNFVDFKRDQAYTTITIESLKKLTDNQLSTEELTLKQLEETHNAEMERLDNIISTAQAQIDALNGINNSVLSVAQALANFAAAMGISTTPNSPTSAGGGTSSSGSGSASMILPNGQFNTSLNGPITRGRYQGLPIGYTEADAGGINWVDGYGNAVDPYAEAQRRMDLRKALGIPGFASGGYHEGGWRMVGENGPELEYTPPSRIYSNGDSKRMLDNSDLLAEIRDLKETIKAGHIAIAGSTGATAKMVKRWEGSGVPVRLADSADPLQVNVVESVPVPVS